MALQDLTPQLRTRLSRMERLVGLFVFAAVLLLLAGLAYYVHTMAKRKGWFLAKAPYFTYLHSGSGLAVGDTVKMMGFPVGEITVITAEKPFAYDENGTMLDVYVEFVVKGDNIGYIWSDSTVKVKSSGLLGARYLEVTKGGSSGSTNTLYETYKTSESRLTQVYTGKGTNYHGYTAQSKPYLLEAEEPPELSSQMEAMVKAASDALPSFLGLTNQFQVVLANLALATTQLDQMFTNAQPLVTNLAAITGNLKDPRGSLGDWLLPTNVQSQLTQTMASATLTLLSANTAVTNTDAQLTILATELDKTLENFSLITSNLNAQVQANTNLLSEVAQSVRATDQLIQGLRQHWFLKGAFKKLTNAPAKAKAPNSRADSPP